MPKLNVNPAANRAVIIIWPYINSSFIFQEATNLVPTPWRPSALTPAFNSNNAVFSVSAPTTNSAKFFRLAQPADLRGIYIYSSDVSSISSDYAQTLTNALGGPVRLASGRELTEVFQDCEWGVAPPFGRLYGLETVLEASIPPDVWLIFETHTHTEAVRIRCADFELLEQPRRLRFARTDV